MVAGRQYLAHRLIWWLHYGVWPAYIDHVNGNRADNRIANLREATGTQNLYNRGAMSNNKCGLKGACFRAKTNLWRAQICVNGVDIHLGSGFHTAEEAHAAYCRAAVKYHGEFARTE